MFLNKLGREMIGGCHMHDDVQLLSSDSAGKGDEASRNACKVCEGCNAILSMQTHLCSLELTITFLDPKCQISGF